MFLAPRSLCAALLCSSILVFAIPASAEEIGRLPGTQATCGWGLWAASNPAAPTLGQTIVAPATDTVLDSFGFHLTQQRNPLTGLPVGDPVTINYRAYVYQWDVAGKEPIGPAVWTSDPLVLTAGPAREFFSISTGGVDLTAGGSYALVVSVDGVEGNVPGAQACWFTAVSDYTGGHGVFLLNGEPTTEPWRSLSDLGFGAFFSAPAPEPVYDFDGFFAPIDNRDASGSFVLNEVRAGQAIPVKFSLNGDQGLDIFATGSPSSEAIACDSQAEVDGIEQTAAAGASGLSYDAASDTYTYVWKTSKSWEDTCRQLVVELDDGTTARANFTFSR